MSTHDLKIQLFRVSSETTERVQIAVFLGELVLLKLVVTIPLSVRDLVIEHFDLLAIEDLDGSHFQLRKLFIIEMPVVIIEESETYTQTLALLCGLTQQVMMLGTLIW